jgi:enoyl-CoA hydratase
LSVVVTRNGAHKQVLLNRPDRRNALGAEIVERLIEVVEESAGDGTRLLELSGAGRNTCAGFDMTDVAAASEGDLVLRFIRIEHLLQALYHASFHTLAFAHGRVVGAGADLVLACRHRIGTPDSMFEMPGAGFGLVLGTRRLRTAVGDAVAADLLSGPFDATKAATSGFLTAVVDRDGWEAISERRLQSATALDGETDRAILRVLSADTRAQDMTDLVASASRPGLKERIAAYIAARKGAPR